MSYLLACLLIDSFTLGITCFWATYLHYSLATAFVRDVGNMDFEFDPVRI